ncbi:hypothetical protein [Rhodoferax sp.]|uniref:hypothetical protein n=1 Tax=Rhodoferax sp. TaxID=50421 RepID=UPI00262B78BC|nr:hypothetical protein [Rhodoferax sp.]MDD5479689.1 hypothetical protein [Rhodoferax sp.]
MSALGAFQKLFDLVGGVRAKRSMAGGVVLSSGGMEIPVGANLNAIGNPGQQGFGVGICPALPTGFSAMYGTSDPASDNYGNYQYTDGSVMVWVPAFFYKIGTGSNGLGVNRVDIRAYAAFANVAAANAEGFALHRAFYNAGAIQLGVFVDKYQCSNNSGVASSVKNGNPLSSSSAHNPFGGLTGAPANNYGGAIAAAKTRGITFFCASLFVHKMLALLSLAHAQASTGTAFCAWFDAAGVTNFPKGNNNNALRDANDATLLYVSDGYSNCAKTGSSNALARTTHNGQACGVADLNGNMWEIAPGLTSDGANYYLLKIAANITTATGGNALATDLWGATGLVALYDNVGTTYESMTASNTNKVFGAATQVLSPAISGTAWAMTGAGIPLVTGVSGSNAFGTDYFYDARPNELCVISGAAWVHGGTAGVWALLLDHVRGNSNHHVGFRSASYL